jgi:hypothetical protein
MELCRKAFRASVAVVNLVTEGAILVLESRKLGGELFRLSGSLCSCSPGFYVGSDSGHDLDSEQQNSCAQQ